MTEKTSSSFSKDNMSWFSPPTEPDTTFHLPRILCLHGGGTNAKIFRAQCRVLESKLRPTFRLCYADAPLPSQAGPDVTSVYKEFGPFRAWLRWRPDDAQNDPATIVEGIETSLRTAMTADDQKGAFGDWVGLLGFSQGAKICASLLSWEQRRGQGSMDHSWLPHFQFGVLLAGRGPLVSLSPERDLIPGFVSAACISVRSPSEYCDIGGMERLLDIPTLHVHGRQDPGLDQHRRLLWECCEQESARLLEWDGHHRVPIKTKDVERLVEEIVAIANRAGRRSVVS